MMLNEPGITLNISSVKRIYVKGKFLYCGNEKFYLKGVTYGTFRPLEDGLQYPPVTQVEKDFSMMADNGINCVRTYTFPPLYLLDMAQKYGIRIMAGLPWEQHITFLDSADRKNDILERVRHGVRDCNKHPAILCYAIGNEIPANIVRWYGKKRIEQFLKRLYKAVKLTDPDCLVTYVNFPTTEYLDLQFLDFYCFNVYLETVEKLSAYISRLHNICGDRPLVLAEIGLDSIRNGTHLQAETIRWQIETIFGKGCAGMFVFSWTDEWWRGGFDIEDWDFGLVDRQRNPKPALHAVNEAMQAVPFCSDELPFISVIVCSYNGAATIRDCMQAMLMLDYPNFEVIVVNDGSTDNLAEIVQNYPVTLITTPNMGLSSARNTGMYNARGEILAYIDDDAYPDPHWLQYLAYAYAKSDHACIGGPNMAPAEDGTVAACVANAPGGPMHVMISDEIAEHVPGCNMSFRKATLLEIGGFDPIYRNAGDDVDVCWRIQKAGYTIGFHAAALVWHHRRNSIRAYWKQQKGYGKAEALLEGKWPEKYNGFGHLAWAGRIYGNGCTLPLKIKKEKVFHGTWGTALFQSVYQPADSFISCVALMPEWYMLTGIVAILATLGFFWAPLLWMWTLFFLCILIMGIQSAVSAFTNVSLPPTQQKKIKYKLLITFLHMIQPLSRLYGRLKHGLTPWRKNKSSAKLKYSFVPGSKTFNIWSEEWRAAEDWLHSMEQKLIGIRTRVKRGGDFDEWDLQVTNSLFSITRGLLTIEEHGAGKQMLKFRVWSTASKAIKGGVAILLLIAMLAALDRAWLVSSLLGAIALIFLAEYILDSANNVNDLYFAFNNLNEAVVEEKELIPTEQEQFEEEEVDYRLPALLSVKFTFQPLAEELSRNMEEVAGTRVFMGNAGKAINE
jgi:O-antigen biosynthesis protein